MTSLPMPLSPVIRIEASDGATCSASRTTLCHRRVAIEQRVALLGDRLEHRGDQLGVGRQRDVFLGAGLDGADRGAGIGADAAGHHRHADALRRQAVDQAGDVELHVHHHQVGALAGAQRRQAPCSMSSTWATLAPRAMRDLAGGC